MAADQGERDRDLDRLLTFVDAIVAIAITLLVLPLVELAPEVEESGGVRELLREHADELGAFALSFFIIARFWLSQHHAVKPLLRGNGRTTWLLLCWAFTMVVMPFPTSLVASAGDEPATKVLYVGTMAASILLVARLRAELRSHPELTDGAPYGGPLDGLVTAGLLLVALVLMLAVPETGYLPLLLLVLDGTVLQVLGRLTNRRAT